MGLDIRITRRRKMVCPKCGEIVGRNDVYSVSSGGRAWYPILKSIGYYVPYEQRTEENDWYGKDMVLTTKQAKEVYMFVQNKDVYDGLEVAGLISTGIYENDDIVINADW